MNKLTGRLGLILAAVQVLGLEMAPLVGPLRPDNWEDWS